ncbi:MAG: hypothetical protein RLW61_23050 [Gammaproteobacteria bacterium]
MQHADLLERIATTLREVVGPAVGDDYAKTQAYMAAVILGKLAGEVRAQRSDAAADAADLDALLADLRAAAAQAPLPRALNAALEALARERSEAHLARLVEELHAAHEALGAARSGALLGRVRETLRARLDRALAWSA